MMIKSDVNLKKVKLIFRIISSEFQLLYQIKI